MPPNGIVVKGGVDSNATLTESDELRTDVLSLSGCRTQALDPFAKLRYRFDVPFEVCGKKIGWLSTQRLVLKVGNQFSQPNEECGVYDTVGWLVFPLVYWHKLTTIEV